VPNIPRTTVGKAPLIKSNVPASEMLRRNPGPRGPTTPRFVESKDV
jgi:hypothetical protein